MDSLTHCEGLEKKKTHQDLMGFCMIIELVSFADATKDFVF